MLIELFQRNQCWYCFEQHMPLIFVSLSLSLSRKKKIISRAIFCFCQFGTRRLCAARTSYCLLLMDSEIFSKLRNWNWSCFLDLVKQTSNPDLSSSAADITVIADIKWCGIQILWVILKISHIPTPHFSTGATEAFSCFLRLVMSNSLSKLLILKLKFKQLIYI